MNGDWETLMSLALGLALCLGCAPSAGTAEAPAAPIQRIETVPAPTAAACIPIEPGALQDVRDTPAAPYFVHHPASGLTDGPTIIFIPGGAGLQRSARRVWESYLAGGEGVDSFRIVIPYSRNTEYLEEFQRTYDILDEVQRCFGGDAKQVHLAGVSNGGYAAFALMLQQPQRFATLLGAPGEFPEIDPATWGKTLAGKAVFNGVGELDNDWKPEVRETHEGLLQAGIESVYVEFPGQAHTAREGFDKSVLFDFWARHSSAAGTAP